MLLLPYTEGGLSMDLLLLSSVSSSELLGRLQKKLDRFRVCFAVSLTMSVFADPTTGDATDWTYAMLGIIHSYSIELRPTSQDERGFIVPPQQIVDSGSEILNGMVELVGNLSD
jgi:hypothetical protein